MKSVCANRKPISFAVIIVTAVLIFIPVGSIYADINSDCINYTPVNDIGLFTFFGYFFSALPVEHFSLSNLTENNDIDPYHSSKLSYINKYSKRIINLLLIHSIYTTSFRYLPVLLLLLLLAFNILIQFPVMWAQKKDGKKRLLFVN